MIVMKFGGTSVGSATAIREAVAIIQGRKAMRPVVVVSAVAGVTNMLLAMGKEKKQKARAVQFEMIRSKHVAILEDLQLDPALLDELFVKLAVLMKKPVTTLAAQDALVSFGERMSARIVARTLHVSGEKSEAFDAWDIGMITDAAHAGAEPLPLAYKRIKQKLGKTKLIPVITGFIGKSEAGSITTLGRGGSDYSAAIIGAAIKAQEIQIWKEVDGILTTDPRIVPEARIVSELAFEEAAELAYFGAKVLHPKAIIPAMIAGVPVRVMNTFKPDGDGTTIVATFNERKQNSRSVEALTSKKGITAVHVLSPEFFDNNGLMAQLFNIFDKYQTSIDVVATSVASVSVTIENDTYLKQIEKELARLGKVVIERKKAILCVVGGSVNAAGVAGTMFTALGNAGISVEMISQAATGISITCVVEEDDAVEALKVLHRELIER